MGPKWVKKGSFLGVIFEPLLKRSGVSHGDFDRFGLKKWCQKRAKSGTPVFSTLSNTGQKVGPFPDPLFDRFDRLFPSIWASGLMKKGSKIVIFDGFGGVYGLSFQKFW